MTDKQRRYAVRRLRPADADAAGRVHVAVWREAYADDMPADYLAALDPAVSAARFRLRAEVDDPEARCHVALDEAGEVVGLAAGGLTRDPDAPTPWELYSINIVAAVQGSGVADQLIEAAIGQRDASLWVLATNARAQSFYRRHGFVPDGATQVHEDTGAGEIRMLRLRGTQTP